MRTIYKYQLRPGINFVHCHGRDPQILSVGAQGGVVFCWAEVEIVERVPMKDGEVEVATQPLQEYTVLHVFVAATGDPSIPLGEKRFIGTIRLDWMVWHAFQYLQGFKG